VPSLVDIKVVARTMPHQALHSLRNLVLAPLPPKSRNAIRWIRRRARAIWRLMRGNWLP